MQKKLRIRFVFLTTLISIIVISIVAIAINSFTYISLLNDADRIITLILNNDLKFDPLHPPHDKVNKEIAFTTRFFEVFLNFDGNIKFINSRAISSVSEQEIIDYCENMFHREESKAIINDFRFVRVDREGGYSYIFLDIEKELLSFRSLIYYSICISTGAIIAIFTLACFLSKKAVFPIVNSYEKQKQFITDVSHEFKTPLSIIKADNEVVEIENGETEWTNSIKTQIIRLNSLVENLITLTKHDEEKSKLLMTEFSLSDALNETIYDFSGTAQVASLKLVNEIEENISYNGDESSIRKLFCILIENAIKYALPNSDIKIVLYSNDNRKKFYIENSCENIEVGKYNNWFERFYRNDKSRNSDTRSFGIGLSIAKSICDSHIIKISAVCETKNIVKISLVF